MRITKEQRNAIRLLKGYNLPDIPAIHPHDEKDISRYIPHTPLTLDQFKRKTRRNTGKLLSNTDIAKGFDTTGLKLACEKKNSRRNAKRKLNRKR